MAEQMRKIAGARPARDLEPPVSSKVVVATPKTSSTIP
jgi:hypothetical protein